MIKHTPGPWFAEKNDSYWEVNPDKGGENEIPFSVANICCSAPGNRDGGLQEANARLIAAAPELLKLISSYIGVVDVLGRNVPPDDWFDQARAVIAKATRG